MSSDLDDVVMKPSTPPPPPAECSTPPLTQTTGSPTLHSPACPISASSTDMDGMDRLPTLGHTPTSNTTSPVTNTPFGNHIPGSSHTLKFNQAHVNSHTPEDTHLPILGTTPTSNHIPDTSRHTSPLTHTPSTSPSSKRTPPPVSHTSATSDHTPPSSSQSPSLKAKGSEDSKTSYKKVSDFPFFYLFALPVLSHHVATFLLPFISLLLFSLYLFFISLHISFCYSISTHSISCLIYVLIPALLFLVLLSLLSFKNSVSVLLPIPSLSFLSRSLTPLPAPCACSLLMAAQKVMKRQHLPL